MTKNKWPEYILKSKSVVFCQCGNYWGPLIVILSGLYTQNLMKYTNNYKVLIYSLKCHHDLDRQQLRLMTTVLWSSSSELVLLLLFGADTNFNIWEAGQILIEIWEIGMYKWRFWNKLRFNIHLIKELRIEKSMVIN